MLRFALGAVLYSQNYECHSSALQREGLLGLTITFEFNVETQVCTQNPG